MAVRPGLQTSHLPGVSEVEANATASPARGKEMRTNLLQKLRPPPLVHAWEFWHDRQDRKKTSSTQISPNSVPSAAAANATNAAPASPSYEDRLVKLHTITDVREFWEVFNNFDFTSLPLRDSVHLFHKGVKPVWEDPRNVRGGAWTFRVPKVKAGAFWKEICLMAIGEQLQEAVKSKRISKSPSSIPVPPFKLEQFLCISVPQAVLCNDAKTPTAFIDDICGISYSIRFTSTLITIWNRDADHVAGIQNILDTVLSQLPP